VSVVAVQPDKRAKEIQDREAGTNLTERARAGQYALLAMAMLPHPAVYFIRRDGSDSTLGSVSRDLRGGWFTENQHTGREHRSPTPAACLAWWVAEQAS
jgi:hypothetical protein